MSDDRSLRHRQLVESLGNSSRRVLLDEFPIEPVRRLDTVSLSKQEENFLRYWVSGYSDVADAARKAGYPAAVARKRAYHLMSQPRIRHRLAEIEREQIAVSGINAENLFREIVTQNLRLARAKVPVDVWNPPCRYCHGDNHEYQRTHAEFEEDFDNHLKKPIKLNPRTGKPIRVPLFDPKGGSGYDSNLPPNEDCPECHGHGDTKHPIIRFKDSRFFTPEERELFNGAKLTKNGIETFWKEQSAARNFLNDLALRMTEYRRPEDAIDITDMSPDRLRQFLEYARDQGFDVDPEALEPEHMSD